MFILFFIIIFSPEKFKLKKIPATYLTLSFYINDDYNINDFLIFGIVLKYQMM